MVAAPLHEWAAFIPTTDGNYFPDFVALDTAGIYWLIEGKADKNANDADVLRKREAAEPGLVRSVTTTSSESGITSSQPKHTSNMLGLGRPQGCH